MDFDFVVLEMNSYRETQVNRNHIGTKNTKKQQTKKTIQQTIAKRGAVKSSPRTSVYSKDRHLLFVLKFSLLRSFASTPPKGALGPLYPILRSSWDAFILFCPLIFLLLSSIISCLPPTLFCEDTY